MKEYLLARFREPSTWRGLIWFLTSFGAVSFEREQAEAVIALGMALAGAAGVLVPEDYWRR